MASWLLTRCAAAAGTAVALAACGASKPLAEPGLIVFAAQPDAADAYGWQLLLADADGGHVRRLTRTDGDGSPAWSPDGSRIAFSRQNDFGDQIWVIDANGERERRLTQRGLIADGPAWSPDGTAIAYTQSNEYLGDDDELESAIYVVDVDGSATHRVADAPGADAGASWSPDGDEISFWSDRDHRAKDNLGEIYLVDADGGEQVRLTHTRGVDSASWSPDWKRLVISSPGEVGLDLFLLDADGHVERQLTTAADDDFGPLWSPDGRRIAFERGTFGDVTSVVLLDVEEGTETVLSPKDTSETSMAWSPDGRWLAVDAGGLLDLVEVESGERRPVDGAYYDPSLGVDWAPASPTD